MSSSSSASETVRHYTKLGQTLPTPSPGSADRVFYETLLKEKPKSEMALEWCVKHGTALEGTESNELFERWNAVRKVKK